jgi:hypothetical protein
LFFGVWSSRGANADLRAGYVNLPMAAGTIIPLCAAATLIGPE